MTYLVVFVIGYWLAIGWSHLNQKVGRGTNKESALIMMALMIWALTLVAGVVIVSEGVRAVWEKDHPPLTNPK